VLCGENGIGGDGEYCGNSDAQLDRTDVLYCEASGGKSHHAGCSSTSNPA
jgi:tubulin beta